MNLRVLKRTRLAFLVGTKSDFYSGSDDRRSVVWVSSFMRVRTATQAWLPRLSCQIGQVKCLFCSVEPF